jgi:dynein heavy chain
VLQNCHLAPSFMAELAQIVDLLQPQVKTLRGEEQDKSSEGIGDKKQRPPHQDFRLWLSSMSCDFFPPSILQSSIKLTSEPPQGIKSSLQRSYNQIVNSKPDSKLYESSTKPDVWQPLFLSLAFFHAIVRERRKFGALGWNTRYDFNDSDLLISMR